MPCLHLLCIRFVLSPLVAPTFTQLVERLVNKLVFLIPIDHITNSESIFFAKFYKL